MSIKKIPNKIPISRFSLGSEEYALVLSLMGKPQDGHIVLANAHPDLPQIDIDALLSSASHSLLARGFCIIPAKGNQPLVEITLKQAVDCLLRYQEVFYLNVVTGDDPLQWTLHVSSSQGFCAHLNKANMVHLLEHGSKSILGQYLSETLGGILGLTEIPVKHFEEEIQLDVLTNLLEIIKGDPIEAELIKQVGWEKEKVELLLEDITHQVLRGTLLQVKTDDVESPEKYSLAKKATLFFLKGKQRTWTFQFPSADATVKGIARVCDSKDFHDILTATVN